MGRPVVHWELWSENPDEATKFYQQVFDWNIQHIPDLKYHVVDIGGRVLGMRKRTDYFLPNRITV
jgi:predicted enzyme related to lactoylglutathione lyase